MRIVLDKDIFVEADFDAERFAKRMMYLAWKACGGPLGMGFLQDNPHAQEDDVWQRITGRGEYAMPTSSGNHIYADYVYGRMMKIGFVLHGQEITLRRDNWSQDYQAFCRKYPNWNFLVMATLESFALGTDIVRPTQSDTPVQTS